MWGRAREKERSWGGRGEVRREGERSQERRVCEGIEG